MHRAKPPQNSSAAQPASKAEGGAVGSGTWARGGYVVVLLAPAVEFSGLVRPVATRPRQKGH